MSNQVKALTVAFESDVSQDYADSIAEAIRHFHYVSKVDFVATDSVNDWLNRSRISRKYEDAIFKTLKELRDE